MPGLTSSRRCPARPRSPTSRGAPGRGPTSAMDPASTLSSWGSSSRQCRRSTRPTRVTAPVPSVVRNVSSVNSRPPCPMRRRRWSAGPPSRRTAIAQPSRSGATRTSASSAADPVHRPFHTARRPAEAGVVQPEQRKTVHSRDVHARAGERHEPGVDEQRGAAAVEVPGELLESHARPSRRRSHRDGVVPAGERLRGDGVEVADHRDVGDRRGAGRAGAGRGAGGGDPPAEPGAAPGAGDERGHVVDVPDGQDGRHRAAPPPQVVQPPPQRTPAGHQERDHRQRHQPRAAAPRRRATAGRAPGEQPIAPTSTARTART